MTTTATPRELASALADVYSDLLPLGRAQDLENDITRAIDQALAAQGKRMADLLAYCFEADNEARQQAAMIRAQQEEIAALRDQLGQSMIDLAAARTEAQAARQCLIDQIRRGQIRTHGQPLEADEHADSLINDEIHRQDAGR